MKNNNITRRNWMGTLGASAVGAGLVGSVSQPLSADPQCSTGGTIIDAHIHLWKLPRSAPPMSDFGTYPEHLGQVIPWLQQDALVPNYLMNLGGRRVSQAVLITSSIGVTPANVIQSNLWMLETAASDTNGPDGESKILAVVGSIAPWESPATFNEQLALLAANPLFVGIRLGDLGSIFNPGPRTFDNIQPNVLQNLTTMARRGLQIDTIGIPGATAAQIGRATGISIVMNHFASEGNTFTPSAAWMRDMESAARYPGLHIKVSDVETLSEAALGGYTFGPAQFQPIADPSQYYPVMEFLWHLFGRTRLLWGSNWPVCRYGGILTDPVDFEIDIWESFLGRPQFKEGRDDIMFKNSLRVYGPGSPSRI